MSVAVCLDAPHRIDVAQIILRVPIPPSANNLFTNVTNGRAAGISRVKGKKYRAWLSEAGWEVKRQSPPFFALPVAVLIEIDLPRQRDMDNAIKPLLDLLVYVQVLQDDSLVDDLRIIRRGEKKWAAVSIWPLVAARSAA
jgi:Holliday junction resolvase RusA-like endonuclease